MAALEDAVAALQAGGVVVLPTDTVYGLAARADDATATAGLFALKGRSEGVPVAVLCADAAQALTWADQGGTAAVRAVAAQWWPGALTLVVPRRAGLDLALGTPAHTIGLRVPDNAFVQALAARVGPLATTSANRHGQPTPATAQEAGEALGPGVALVVDGPRLNAPPSTVVDTTTWPWTVLRAGAVDAESVLQLAAATGGSYR